MSDRVKTHKHKFFKNLIILVFLFFIFLAVIVSYKLNGIKSTTIGSILNTTINNVESELTITMENLHSQIKIVQEWGNNGLINLDKKDKLLNQISPLLEQFKLIKSIIIVSDEGKTFYIEKKDNYYVYEYSPNRNTKLTIYNNKKEIVSEKEFKNKRDFREYKWYRSANSINYYFYYNEKDKDKIATLSIRWNEKNTNKSGVIAFEVSSEFISNINKKFDQESGCTFLLDKKKRIVHLNKNIINEKINNKFFEVLDRKSIKSFTTFSLKVDKDRWWVGIKPLKKNSDLMLVIVIPEKDILPNILKEKYKWYSVFAAIFILAVIIMYILFKSYNNSLNQIKELRDLETMDDKTKVLNLIKAGESSKLEFKSTVRMNLKSGKSGKEIEKAWLKNVVAFLNTEGGSVLIGVADDGKILGLESDNFKNKDNCMLHISNLIKQHIGIEFSSFLDIECVEIDGKDVILIEVTKSPEPAFLHMSDKEEDFFIRSGPSCIQLSISKAVKYIIDKQINKENQN